MRRHTLIASAARIGEFGGSSFKRCGEIVICFIISQHWHVTHEELLKEAPVITGSYPSLFYHRSCEVW